ncbi:MAG TPA: PAS domain-containing protein, partial [Pyrinomonadaceae bacterium]|nr:PAS domain-containing protein [Pyrinomonadaceae bacterium]
MSRGDNQSRKTDAVRTHPSAGPIEQKISTNGDPVEGLASNQNTNKKQYFQLPKKYLEPVESQALLSMAMEISRMGAWELDRASGAVYWSPELEEIFGLEPGSFPGTRDAFHELVYKDDREDILSEIEIAVREHRPYSIEFRFYHSDGSIRWMEGRGEAVYSEKGEPVRLYGVGIDITKRKQSEEALLETEQRFVQFMHNLPGLAW